MLYGCTGVHFTGRSKEVRSTLKIKLNRRFRRAGVQACRRAGMRVRGGCSRGCSEVSYIGCPSESSCVPCMSKAGTKLPRTDVTRNLSPDGALSDDGSNPAVVTVPCVV